MALNLTAFIVNNDIYVTTPKDNYHNFTSRQKIDGNAQPRKCHYWGALGPYPLVQGRALGG